jgi:UDP-glucose:(heptosyl)LPS alpha-1,3-glucosyltransferase
MKIAFCYESVLPARGGCETYIADLARRLAADRHELHLYTCEWDAAALPADMDCHRLPRPRGPRFLKPWRFSASCLEALRAAPDQISIGFNKTWGLDILYPLGGLHAASVEHNYHKHQGQFRRGLARIIRGLDLAHRSFALLERRQYLGPSRPVLVVNSEMVRGHFREHYGIPPEKVHVVRSAIDPERFAEPDRPRRRAQWRQEWGIAPDETAGLFIAMNYRLKGLEPLLHAVALLPAQARFRLLVAGSPRLGSYQRLAHRLGIMNKVTFLGPRRDVQNCYFAADFLVHPTFYDPCSLVVLEALACGLPVITTRFNGASELLHPPGEGYVVNDPQDYGELAGCMAALLDPAVRAACAQAARRSAQDWTFEHHYRQILQVFAAARERRFAA